MVTFIKAMGWVIAVFACAYFLFSDIGPIYVGPDDIPTVEERAEERAGKTMKPEAKSEETPKKEAKSKETPKMEVKPEVSGVETKRSKTKRYAFDREMSDDLKRTLRLAKYYYHGVDCHSDIDAEGLFADFREDDYSGVHLANHELAVILFEEVYQMGKLLFGENDPLTLEGKFYPAETKKALLNFDEAMTLYGEIAEVRSKGARVPDAMLLTVKLNMANILRDTSNRGEALRLFSECLDILESDPPANPGFVENVKTAIAGLSL
ncbi:MAG: hypothetical protein LBF41_00475 [Deltaproteobacteria bacterium]|nr:hypothetical protein [Deltaproteobacteria bacterium]